MRIFNRLRLAYFDELGEDPEISKLIQTNSIESRFIFNLESGEKWSTSVAASIPEIRLKGGKYLVPSGASVVTWGYLDKDRNNFNLNSRGQLTKEETRGTLSQLETEIDVGNHAIWDTKTKSLWFTSADIIRKINSDNAYKVKFCEALAAALDSGKLAAKDAEMEFNI